MAIAGRIKLSESEVSQEFDLGEIYDRAPTNAEIQNFIELAKERIIERSQSGVDRNGNRFKRYTSEYAEQKGVGRNDVDMTLFGDMLLSIEGEARGDKVKLIIPEDEAPKAFGHMTGFQGHPYIKNGPKRQFFGLTREEVEAIALSVQDTTIASDEIDIGALVRAIGLVADGN